ncbi:MAG: metallopeptidase family protein [Actinomycetales bacterium]|nr:metallopeptidase family protein [Actinomycetales bacterium]
MRRATRARPGRSRARERHGRALRSPVTGPELPPLRTREETFDATIASAIDYLRELWPQELATLQVQVGEIPPGPPSPDEGVDRWRVDRRARRVVLYRIPIERLAHLHVDDEWHRRSYLESCVFRAVAELLGKDPWEIAPERYRHF